MFLLVPEGFDGVEAGGPQRRQETTDDTHKGEDAGGGQKDVRRQDQIDVGFASGVVEHAGQEGKGMDDPDDGIGKQHSDNAAQERDDQAFQEELKEDME